MSDEAEVLTWCMVANVAGETTRGQDGEVRRGLKHFAAGAKVWVLPPQWGDGGEKVFVIGRHRGRGPARLARLVVDRCHLRNYRVRGVYSPSVHRELTRPWQHWGDHALRLWESRELVAATADRWNRLSAGASEVRRPRQRTELLECLESLPTGHRWPAQRVDQLDGRGSIGDVLRDDREAAAVESVQTVLRRVVESLGSDVGDERCSADPRWSEVVDAAAAAMEILAG